VFCGLGAFSDLFVHSSVSTTDKRIRAITERFLIFCCPNCSADETNDVGYHPSLGIIDRFSRTLKEKLFKSFSLEKNVVWDTKLKSFINAYNKTPHRSLNDISPNKVKDHLEAVYNINIQKNKHQSKHNFASGQNVRVKLARPLFTKGYKQKYSDEVYTIESINGVNAILTNGDKVKLNDLLIVQHTVDNVPNVEKKAVEIDKRIDRRVNKEGIERNEVAIRRSARERKPNQLINEYGQKVFF
jgi:hypothetical protein